MKLTLSENPEEKGWNDEVETAAGCSYTVGIRVQTDPLMDPLGTSVRHTQHDQLDFANLFFSVAYEGLRAFRTTVLVYYTMNSFI